MPKLKNNMVSIGQFKEKGFDILFGRDKCKVFHYERGLIIETKRSSNRLYKLHAIFQPMGSKCFNTILEDILQLWH